MSSSPSAARRSASGTALAKPSGTWERARAASPRDSAGGILRAVGMPESLKTRRRRGGRGGISRQL